MLTGKEEKPPRLTRSNRGNHESEQLPEYLRSTFSDTFKLMEPPRAQQGKKIKPQFAFGNSLESPSFFRSPNSMICKESYDNPFLKARAKPISKWEALRSMTLTNHDFYNVSDQKFSNLPNKGQQRVKMINTITNQVHYVQTPQVKGEDHTFQLAYRTLQTSSLFGKKHDLFTDFIEKNDKLNVYGHLNDRQRPKGQFRDTKDFSLTPQQIMKKKRGTFLHSNSMSKSMQKTGSLLPLVQVQTEKYYNKDQKFLNQLSNSIIVTHIGSKLKNQKEERYNADTIVEEYRENDIGLIEVFEKHLEFEKQYGN